MSKTNPKQIYINWSEIEQMCHDLADKLKKLNFIPDIIITPLRGGVIPSVILSHIMDIKDIVTIEAKRTRDDSVEAERTEVIIGQVKSARELSGKNILLLDEIADTGETMTKLHSYLSTLAPKRIITATLFINLSRMSPKNHIPDITIRRVDKWVTFPWENNVKQP